MNNNNNLILFVFSGQTRRWNRKALSLYFENANFKESMDLIDKKMNDKYFGYSMIEKAFKLDGLDIYENDQFFTHTMLFMYQVSLYSLYKLKNIYPTQIMGISCGEVSALYISGILDLDKSCELVYQRAKVLNETLDINGKMVGVFCNKSLYEQKYSHLYKTLEQSLFISPNSFVLSGSIDEIEDLSKRLYNDNIKHSALNKGTRFHCSVQDNCKQTILSLNIKPSNPTIPFISAANVRYFDDTYKFDQNHLYLNIRNPCHIQQSYEAVLKQFINTNKYKKLIICEMSPSPLGTGPFITNDILPSNYNNTNIKDSIKIMSHLNDKPYYFDELLKEINK